MFTAAMAYALGLSLDQIRTGLRTFDNTFFQSPGRMNIFDEHGFRVILDYGHNEAAVGAMVDLVERLAPARQAHRLRHRPRRPPRRGHPRHRRQGRRAFRHLHLPRRRQPARPRARRGAEADAGGADRARRARGRDRALRRARPPRSSAALTMARPNDLVLIFCDAITRSLEADHLLPPQGDAEAGAAGDAGRRRRLRRAGGLPHPERRARRPHRAGRLRQDGASLDRSRRAAQASSPSSAAGSRTATSRSSPRCTGCPAAASWSSPPPRPSPKAVGAESAAGLPRPRLRGRGRAAHHRQRPPPRPRPRALRPRRRLRQRLLHRRRPGEDRRRARARRRRDPAPRGDPRRAGRGRARRRLQRRRGDDVAADDPRRHLDRSRWCTASPTTPSARAS